VHEVPRWVSKQGVRASRPFRGYRLARVSSCEASLLPVKHLDAVGKALGSVVVVSGRARDEALADLPHVQAQKAEPTATRRWSTLTLKSGNASMCLATARERHVSDVRLELGRTGLMP
jgi:hypothetical protein